MSSPCLKNEKLNTNLFDYWETGVTLDDFWDNFPSMSHEQVVQALALQK
jgi:uncharacterized protein (DUF433 family)